MSWEIQRYRLLRHKLLERYRQHAIEYSLLQIDLAGIPSDFADQASEYIRHNAHIWRIDPGAANEIEARLLTYGFDEHSINVEVYIQAREAFLVFEALITSAHSRRMSLLREIERQRHAGRSRQG